MKAKQLQVVDFRDMRSDWYHGVDYVVRLLSRACSRKTGAGAPTVFRAFPLQWIPVFEWLGLSWDDPLPPTGYLPFICLKPEALVDEVNRARRNGQLRLLVEAIASCDPVISEAIPRLDAKLFGLAGNARNRLGFPHFQHARHVPEAVGDERIASG